MIVVDASVLSNALADFGNSGRKARRRLTGERSAAPDLAYVETAAVIRKQWMRNALTEVEMFDAMNALRSYPLTVYGMAGLLPRAYELRSNVTPYDAMYLSLAEGLGCPLVTADARLASVPGVRCRVEVLED